MSSQKGMALDNITVSLTVLHGEKRSEFSSVEAFEASAPAFDGVTSVTLILLSLDSPVRAVSLSCDDWGRRLLVEGPAGDSVAAVSLVAADAFGRHSTVIGGRQFRIAFWCAVYIGMVVGLTLVRSGSIKGGYIRRDNLTNALLVLLVLTWLIPTDKWFSGFRFLTSSDPWLRHYYPELSLASPFVPSLLGAGVRWFKSRRSKGTPENEIPTSTTAVPHKAGKKRRKKT